MKLNALVYLILILVGSTAKAGETYGVILSGGADLENNHYRYYDSTKKMYLAFRSAGIKRDNITTLYADGGRGVNTVKVGGNPWTLYFTDEAKKFASPTSLEGDGRSDIKYPASSIGISATFNELAKNLKAGDNVVFFITDHGSKYDGIILWNGEDYSVSQLQEQLDKLPSGVTAQIATNICYGGQLLQLTGPNVCVVANTDDKRPSASNNNDDPFATSLANTIKRQPTKTNGRPSLLDAFEAGKEGDLSANKVHLTSIDYFIQNQPNYSQLAQIPSCGNQQSPLTSIQKEITEITNYLSKVNDPRRGYYEKYLKKKLVDISKDLNSYRNQYSEWVRSGYQKKLNSLKAQWSKLSDNEKQRSRPYYTGVAEKLQAEDEYQRKKVDSLVADQTSALAEMRFLKGASSDKLEQYYNIRRCLEHEI